MSKNTLIKEVAQYAENLQSRLARAKEGGVIILATSDDGILMSCTANKDEVKKMLGQFLRLPGIRQAVTEICKENMSESN